MKIKTFFVIFSNARSILKLMLCNRNLTKLVYLTLLSSNRRALALKLSELLKKIQNFHKNKDINLATKITIIGDIYNWVKSQQSKFQVWRPPLWFIRVKQEIWWKKFAL